MKKRDELFPIGFHENDITGNYAAVNRQVINLFWAQGREKNSTIMRQFGRK